ncbi:putative protein [alpha proteobacterium Q-1]|nr:putative protein [alpha proteobacterium Q-1]
MRKILLAIVVLLLLVIGGGAFWLYTEGEEAIRAGLERHTPPILGAPVSLAAVSFSPFSGAAGIKGFRIGNPDGYSDADALQLDSLSIRLEPRSVLTDLIKINDITIDAPKIHIEPGPGTTNLQTIQKNIESFIAQQPAEEEAATANIFIDHFRLNDAVISIGGGSIGFSDQTLTLADIHLEDIGGANGMAPADAAQLILKAVMPQIQAALASDLGRQLLGDARAKLDNLEGKARQELNQELEKAKSKLGDSLKEQTDKLPEGTTDKIEESVKSGLKDSGLGGLLKKKKPEEPADPPAGG